MDIAARTSERRHSALAVSHGVGIGPVVFLYGEKRHFFRIDLDETQVDDEIQRFQSAADAAVLQLKELASDKDTGVKQPVSSILGVHLLIIQESSLIQKIESTIRSDKVNAEWALKLVSDSYLEKQAAATDLRFREKYLDIEDVADRLLKSLIGTSSTVQLACAGAVVVAYELRPSTIVDLNKSKPAALITDRGGWTSHSSILAREFHLPMVSGIRDLDRIFSPGDQVIVDGLNGEVIINPSPEAMMHFHSVAVEEPGELGTKRTVSNPLTLDGTEIILRANADFPEAARSDLAGGQGIGLYRSESLIRDPDSFPTEDEQVAAYIQIAEAAGAHGVKVRTFDIESNQARCQSSRPERNPALGLRSIRLSLLDTTHFRPQLRAILRASFEYKLDIVLPMISGLSEIKLSKEIIEEERQHLRKKGIPIGEPKLGAMIEVPSSVLSIRDIARNVDFLCLGTNDLVQYLLAVDRDNDAVADWYQTLHPSVIRAVSEVISAAKDVGIPITVCGEMAGSPFYVPLLIGLGARELSMNVSSIQQVRRLIPGITLQKTIELVQVIRSFETAEETEAYLRDYYRHNWDALFPSGLLSLKQH